MYTKDEFVKRLWCLLGNTDFNDMDRELNLGMFPVEKSPSKNVQRIELMVKSELATGRRLGITYSDVPQSFRAVRQHATVELVRRTGGNFSRQLPYELTEFGRWLKEYVDANFTS